MSNNDWSDWLDFNEETFNTIPEVPGVFMMHAAMKILFIGGSENMKTQIKSISSDKCISNATRFRYRNDSNFKKTCQELIEDFQKRHEGKMPGCMNK